MAAAIPLVSTGISVIGGLWNKHKQGQQQKKDDAAAAGPLAAQQAQGDALSQQGAATYGMGRAALGGATNYYQRLLGGDKSQLAQAVAPERAALTDTYRGAERGLDRTGAQGAARDIASADLNRDRAGKIGALVSGVRPGAAAALGNLGQAGVQMGIGATQGAGGIYAQMLNGLNAKRDLDMRQAATNDANNTSLWQNIGKLLVGSYQAYSNPRPRIDPYSRPESGSPIINGLTGQQMGVNP